MKDEDRKSFYSMLFHLRDMTTYSSDILRAELVGHFAAIKWSELKEAVLASFEPAQDNGTRCDTFQWKTRLYSEGSKVAPRKPSKYL